MDNIVAQALSAVAIVKVLVDALKLAWVAVPQWVPPAVAFVAGPATVVLLMVASGEAIGPQQIAQAVLAGILAAGGAIGVTELGNRAQFPKTRNWGG